MSCSSVSRIGHEVCFTLDVLTDGSEYTGHGTLFLSVWRAPTASITTSRRTREDENRTSDHKDEEDDSSLSVPSSKKSAIVIDAEYMETSPPLARYAISGAGDSIARLCADQRFKLASTRAVFMPQSSWESQSADGLSALFLALYSAGAPFLHVVAPSDHTKSGTEQSDTASNQRYPPHGERFRPMDDDWIEELASITLGRHKHFDIRTCIVQKDTESSSDQIAWWKVFEDEYVVVHAGSCPEMQPSAQTSSLIYLYSFGPSSRSRKDANPHPQQQSVTDRFPTLAVLPPDCQHIPSVLSILKRKRYLPTVRNDIPITIDYIIALNPPSSYYQWRHNSGAVSEDHSKNNGEAEDWFVLQTSPQNHLSDEGLLMRSQQISQYFHQHMPWAFAATRTSLSTNESAKEVHSRGSFAVPSSSVENTTDPFRLISGTSIVLQEKSEMTSVHHSPSSLLVIDRRTAIFERPVRDEWTSTLESLRTFIPDPTHTLRDDNEIDLDDADSEYEQETGDRDNPHHPLVCQDGQPRNHLLVLGTGCATPSAYRGASGYALVMSSPSVMAGIDGGTLSNTQTKKTDIFLLDCGEGSTAMLSRSVRGSDLSYDWTGRIRGIWISHAHLDHFGGLPPLLRILHNHRNKHRKDPSSMVNPQFKRPRYHNRTQGDERQPYETERNVPWIMAPPKVLRYLDVLLHCRHGLSIDDGSNSKVRYFWPRLHHDPTPPNGPWVHFEPIKVDHNCCPSYGLLVGWAGQPGKDRIGNPTKSFFCYSGDTRPCREVVKACQRVLVSRPSSIPWTSSSTNDVRSSGASSPTNLFLVHEATFADTDGENAIMKKHSTISEAMDVATTIPATRVLLSHFSQRYVSLDSNIGSSQDNVHQTPLGIGGGVPVGLATDGLWIPLD